MTTTRPTRGRLAAGMLSFVLATLPIMTGADDPQDPLAKRPTETSLDYVARLRQLGAHGRALEALETFARTDPNSRQAAWYHDARGHILFDKGRAELNRSHTAEPKMRGTRRQKVAKLFDDAQTSLKQAHDRYEAVYKAFPPYVPEEDAEQLSARNSAELNYMRAQLDLARLTYYRAQTHPSEVRERDKLLTQAASEFETVHQRYRSQIVGLYARMWQARCFQEQQDIGRAMGIYNELLSHPGKSNSLRRLQDEVRLFRLICLNHEQRKDYQLVIQEAGHWLEQNETRAGTLTGLGIRWQLVTAHTNLAQTPGLEKDQRERSLRQALHHAEIVHRSPGRYRDASGELIARLRTALGM